MFFKRIEMTGFKSFATKTVIDLLPGVTVVVGPNGCGKSNIFDAVRWVLGEQSAKSLRGNRMGDVVFQGSATYKPMGCAQVTLVIENEDGRLPIDFSEVSISRRLYRSGESEYLINKVPCRLRDIHELFLGTGVGTESYSIMEQGRVGEIVRSKPEDRRLLFEEAAGISKYRTRKAEALRKLERTEQDLVRLADRIAECRTRCISLKRQASKAERYKGLRETLDAVDKKLLVLGSGHLLDGLRTLEKEFSEANDHLAVVRARNDSVQARREELQLQVEMADGALRDLSMQKEDQRQYISDAANEIVRLRGLAEGEQRRARDIEDQTAEVAVREEELAANLAEINAEEARLTVQCIALESRQNARRAEYDRLRADGEATRKKMRELRKALETSADEVMRLRNERSRLQLLLEQASAFEADSERQKREHEEAIVCLEGRIEAKRGEIDSGCRDLKRLEQECQAAREKASAAAQARDRLRGEQREAERRLHESRSRLQALERLASDYEGYYAGVKAVMVAASKGRLEGVVGVVPEMIRPIQAEHDLAVEVALGNHVQDIIARSADCAKRAIEFLKSSGAGRATFLPLDILQAREPGPEIGALLDRPGVLGLASRLVAYDAAIERAVSYLLGRTIVTENVDVSLEMFRSGQRHRYVTLDGQLTSPSGAMTGGSRNRSQIVTRQREIEGLARDVRELEEAESQLRGRMKEREQAIVDHEATAARLREEIGDLRLELGRRETELAAQRDARDSRREILGELIAKVEANRESSSRHAVERDRCDAALARQAREIEQRRDDLALMEEAVYGRNEEVDRLGDDVSLAEQEITRLSTRAAHLRESALALFGERQSQERRIGQLRADQARSQEEARAHLDQARRVEGERRGLEIEVEQIAERQKTAAEEKERAQIAIHEMSDQAAKLLQEFNVASNRQGEAQVDLVNAQAKLQNLRERARERFDLSLEDLTREVGDVAQDRADLEGEYDDLMADLRKMGDSINMGALVEYEEENERYEFLTAQERDLIQARASLRDTIATIDKTTQRLFWDAFEHIRENFIEVYRRLFGGGKADLLLQEVEDGDPLLEGGIEIVAQPPGKKLRNISLLSGGEQALTAVSLMFAIFMYKPSPFCVMDEIDAPLDDANVMRFRAMLHEFSQRSQFIIITHNKITMQLADTLYGITMQETGVSSVVSVAFDQVDAIHAEAS